MKKLKNQNGRSMIEMLGVLAIIGVLSVGGIAGYSKATMKYRVNKTIEQITLIAGNVRTFFANQRNYDGVNDRNIIKKAKLVPDEMIEYCTTGGSNECPKVGDIHGISNEFGPVSLTSAGKSSSSGKDAFSISFSGMPAEACIEICSHDWRDVNLGAMEIYIGGGQVSVKKIPMDVDAAVNFCLDREPITLYFDIDVNSTYWSSKFN
ncbi:MAG: hypothetical protein IJ525_02185 [Alphaproteobacteria bacterium]|nr:hypothetical protein [Alphaproteobacteria bacterium]